MSLKKKFFCVFLCLLLCATVFAVSDLEKHFTEKGNAVVLPVDSVLGQVVDDSTDEDHIFLALALRSPFDIDWTDRFFAEETRKTMASVHSPLFSEILPSENFLMSRSLKNGDGSVSITVRFENGSVITFTMLDKKIIAVK